MNGIADAPNYATDCPVMMICGYDQGKAVVGELKAWVFPKASSGQRTMIVDAVGSASQAAEKSVEQSNNGNV